jgi:MFS family permease
MPEGLRSVSGYARLWWASTVSGFGTAITALAMQILIVVNLHGSATDVGLFNAARWLPYMLFGLVAGVLVDRIRRKPVLVIGDIGRALVLILVPVLAFTHHLSIALLAALMFVFGTFALAGDAAAQSFLPRLVPVPLLTRANARLDQGSTAAQTSGPALAGALIGAIGAPWAVIVDAVSYVFSALLLASIRVEEPAPVRREGASLGREIGEGLRWVYGHPALSALALTTHAWFICSGMAGAVFVPFVIRTLHLGTVALGIALSLAGIGGLAGSLAATRLGSQFGEGRTITVCRAVTALAYMVLAFAPANWLTGSVLIGLGQFVLGLSMGAENPNEMSYRQSITPDRLQGRTNATMRSINRAMIVVAAPLGGLLADRIGYRAMLWIVAAGFACVALALSLSRFRTARASDVA